MVLGKPAPAWPELRWVQGGPLASKQITQEKLVFMLSEITKAQLLALRVGRIKDAGQLDPAMMAPRLRRMSAN